MRERLLGAIQHCIRQGLGVSAAHYTRLLVRACRREAEEGR